MIEAPPPQATRVRGFGKPVIGRLGAGVRRDTKIVERVKTPRATPRVSVELVVF